MNLDYHDGFLAPCRVLDCTDHRGLLAGHILAQLGADVVQMEPPGAATVGGNIPSILTAERTRIRSTGRRMHPGSAPSCAIHVRIPKPGGG